MKTAFKMTLAAAGAALAMTSVQAASVSQYGSISTGVVVTGTDKLTTAGAVDLRNERVLRLGTIACSDQRGRRESLSSRQPDAGKLSGFRGLLQFIAPSIFAALRPTQPPASGLCTGIHRPGLRRTDLGDGLPCSTGPIGYRFPRTPR